jgi:pilus assembly protein Flp/PilA
LPTGDLDFGGRSVACIHYEEISMIATLTTMLRDDDGATMVEYGLMLAFVAIVALVGVKAIGTGLNTLFNNVAGSL